jgi:hypothetical protein
MSAVGDFLGEDLLFEAKNNNFTAHAEKVQHLRQETAYSEGDTYLLECDFKEWPKLKDVLILMKLRKDYLLIDNHLKKCYYQKKAWRQIKSKVTGHQFAIDPI